MVDVTLQAGPLQAPCICGTPFDYYVGTAAIGDSTQWFFAALLDHGRRVLWVAYVTGEWREGAGESWLTISTEMQAEGAMAHLRDPAESPFRDLAPFSSLRPLLPADVEAEQGAPAFFYHANDHILVSEPVLRFLGARYVPPPLDS